MDTIALPQLKTTSMTDAELSDTARNAVALWFANGPRDYLSGLESMEPTLIRGDLAGRSSMIARLNPSDWATLGTYVNIYLARHRSPAVGA